ncbi:MAG: HAMP domain-containing histidine kinase [Bdellovibrionales bacterium]|nr:HAMP domain-containing histidine kinase [Bdellovibrionales bacterium]
MSKNLECDIFKFVTDEAILGFLIFDLNNESCTYQNKMARDLFDGIKEDQLKLSHLFADSSASKSNDFKPFSEDLLNLEGFFQSILMNKPSGRMFIANVGVKKIQGDQSNLRLLMIQDITIQSKLQRDVMAKQFEIKSAYEELVKQNEQLKELDKAKDKFLSLMTHELRTPVSAMFASAEILKDGLYDTEEELKDFIETIYTQGIHLTDLVNDILDFSKVKARKMEYYIEQKDLRDVIKDEIAQNSNFAKQSGISIKYDQPDTPVLCYYDTIRLKQVMSNLISNAIKYNKEKGSVHIYIEQLEDQVKLYVQDTGKGIPEDKTKKVFDEFETLGSLSSHQKGTGLGMPISKTMIEDMGGSIDLTSKEGEGTLFWICIPTVKVLEEDKYRSRDDENFDLAL